VVGVLPTSPLFAFEIEKAVSDVRGKNPDKPIAFNIIGSKDMVDLWTKKLEEIGIPIYPSIERCVKALAVLCEYHLRRHSTTRP